MQGFILDVQGDFACFTRPEMKVERVSYDVITPSAARAIFESICWKPAIRWQVQKIDVLSPIRWTSLRRNEVGSVVSSQLVKSAMRSGSGALALYADEDRQQRASLLLRDVRYRLHARFELSENAGNGDNAGKFAEMFRRRASRGQCVNQPYLGCREFAARVRLIENLESEPAALPESREFGYMLYDLDFSTPADPKPRFFKASMQQGVVQVPAWNSTEVRG